jgi:nucleotide-binding universal stress UspA family protein
MIKNVLVTTDFSEIGNRAVKYAFKLISGTDAKIYVCNINEVPKIPSPLYAHYRPEHIMTKEEIGKLHRKTKEKLSGLINDIPEAKNMNAESIVVETPLHIHEEIVRLANHLKVDLIIMATHGVSGITNLITGSTTKEVIRSSNLPILVIPPKADN